MSLGLNDSNQVSVGNTQTSIDSVQLNMSEHLPTTQLKGTLSSTQHQSIPVLVLIDNGATSSFISSRIVEKYNLIVSPCSNNIGATTANNAIIPIKYQCTINFTINSYTESLTLFVLNGIVRYDVILGNNWLIHKHAVQDYDKHSIEISHQNSRLQLCSNVDLQLISCHEIATLLNIQWQHYNKKLINSRSTSMNKHKQQRKNNKSQVKDDIPEYRFYLLLFSSDTTDTTTTDNTPYSKQLLSEITAEFSDVVGDIPPELPPRRAGVDHTIPLVDGAQPVSSSPYRTSSTNNDELKKQIDELLKAGFIRPSQSPYASPVLFVQKKDGSIRMCIDYRALNKITVPNKYPLPHPDELLERLVHAKYLTKLDLRSGYHQIRMSEADIPKTSFTTRYGSYEYLVMPFGLRNAPATFMSTMNTILKPYLDNCVIVFIDDIMIYSTTQSQHTNDVKQVFAILRKHKFYAKLSKCEFGKSQTEFLGHIVGNGGIRMLPTKVQAILDWPILTDVTSVRSFLGLCNYYRRFVNRYSMIAAPLFDLLRADKPFAWTQSQQQSFDQLKQAMTSAPILALPDYNKEFYICTDASGYGIGGVLCQLYDSVYRPLMFISHKLTGAELNWPTHDKELYAIIYTLKQCRPYLDNKRVNIITDHQSLIYIQRQPKLTAKQARWNAYLANFDCVLMYQPGKNNVIADSLSRRPDHIPDDNELQAAPTGTDLNIAFNTITLNNKSILIIECYPVTTIQVGTDFIERVRTAYNTDSICKNIIDTDGNHKFTVRDSLIYKQTRLYIPAAVALINLLLEEYHDSKSACHRGVDKTYNLLIQHYYWPRMYKNIESYIQSCEICQQNKVSNRVPAGLLQQPIIPTVKFESLSMDFITHLPHTTRGNNGILVIVDRYSKFCKLVPIKSNTESGVATAKITAELVKEHWIRDRRIPAHIISDRDPQFTSQFWIELWAAHHTKLSLSSSYHPETDGQTERVNRTLEEALRCYVNDTHDDWDTHLSDIESALNNSTHTTTGVTPYYAVYNEHKQLPGDLVKTQFDIPQSNPDNTADKIKQRILDHYTLAQAHQKRYADLHRRHVEYDVGQYVYVQSKYMRAPTDVSSKLQHRYAGPYKIISKIGPVAYRLQLPSNTKLHNVFHVSKLREYYPRLIECVDDDGNTIATSPDLIDDQYEYEIDRIMSDRTAKRGKKSIQQYLVKWRGFDKYYNTWESAESLTNAQQLIQQYRAQQSNKQIDQLNNSVQQSVDNQIRLNNQPSKTRHSTRLQRVKQRANQQVNTIQYTIDYLFLHMNI